MNRISVILPVYNVAEELPRCLDSVLGQSQPNLEIVAVDDGSTDGAGAILDRYAQRHPNIRVIHTEHGGVTRARMRGVAQAEGTWIGFVDGDDEIDPDMYRRLLANALDCGADISHCGYRMAFPDGRVRYFHNTRVLKIQDRLTALGELLSGRLVEPSLGCKLFRRSLFEGLAMPADIRNNEDLLMNFCLFSRAERTVFDDWCPYCYHVRENSASRGKGEAHRILDPIRVRACILRLSPAELVPGAQAAFVSACIDAYNSMLSDGQGRAEEKAAVREALARHYPWTKRLNPRRRLLAALIRYIPWACRPLYGLYARFFRKNPYE